MNRPYCDVVAMRPGEHGVMASILLKHAWGGQRERLAIELQRSQRRIHTVVTPSGR